MLIRYDWTALHSAVLLAFSPLYLSVSLERRSNGTISEARIFAHSAFAMRWFLTCGGTDAELRYP